MGLPPSPAPLLPAPTPPNPSQPSPNFASILTIHNNPANLKPPAGTKHLQIEMPDIDSADLTPWLRPAYEFIEEARSAGHSEWGAQRQPQ